MVTDVDTWAEAVVDTITVGAVGVVITMAGHAVVIAVGAKLKTRDLMEGRLSWRPFCLSTPAAIIGLMRRNLS